MAEVFKALDLDGITVPKGVDVARRRVSGWLSTVEMDRDGEIVNPDAFTKHLDVYKANPVLLLHHLHKTLPVGKAVNIEVRPEGLWGEYEIARTPIGNEVLQLLAEGCLRGFSAGFVPIDAEENPPVYKVPAAALKTAMGKKPKKLFREVELVEVSLLAIPSNRSSLVTQKEMGNHVAGLVLKMFDASPEDVSDVISQWVIEQKGWIEGGSLSSLILVDGQPKYSLKSLIWDESKHPRNDDGKFTDKFDDSVYSPAWSGKPINVTESGKQQEPLDALNEQKKKIEEQSKVIKDQTEVLKKVLEEQKKTKATLDEINSKDSYTAWFKKWAVRILVATALVVAFKQFKKTSAYPEVKQKITEWLMGKIQGKGMVEPSDIDPFLESLTLIRQFLRKGEELGLTATPEYAKAKKVYDSIMNHLKGMVDQPQMKGLSSLISKGMTAEQFKEDEHPRGRGGKFARKDEASETIDQAEGEPEPEIPPEEKPKSKKPKSKKKKSEDMGLLRKAIFHPFSLTFGEQLKVAAIQWAVLLMASYGYALLKDPKFAKQMGKVIYEFSTLGYWALKAKHRGTPGFKAGMKLARKAQESELHKMYHVYRHEYYKGVAEHGRNFNDPYVEECREIKKILERTGGFPTFEPKNLAEAKERLEHWAEKAHEDTKAYEHWEDVFFGRKLRHPEMAKEGEGKVDLKKEDKIANMVRSYEKMKGTSEFKEGEYEAAKRAWEKATGKKWGEKEEKWFKKYFKKILTMVKNARRHAPKSPATRAMEELLLTGDAKKAQRFMADNPEYKDFLSYKFADLKVTDKTVNKEKSKLEKQISDYIHNVDGFQKDLDESFGELKSKGLVKKVEVYNNSPGDGLAGLFPEDENAFQNVMKSLVTAYHPYEEMITVNLKQLETVAEAAGFKGNIPIEKAVMIHESAHSIFCPNESLKLKYYSEFEEEIKKIKGKRIVQTLPFTDPPTKWEYEIADVDIRKEPAFVEKELLPGVKIDPLKTAVEKKQITPEKAEELRKWVEYNTYVKYRPISKDVKEYIENSNKSMIDAGMPPIIDKDGCVTIKMGDWMQRSGGVDAFDIVGMNRRDIYSCLNLDEFIAVKAEKGHRFGS